MTDIQGVDSEVGQLKTVLVHRPGLELQRMTPRHVGRLLFGTLPWVSKAREEHDALCQQLRDQGVRVLYFTALLQETLEYAGARDEAVRLAVADTRLGDELRAQLRAYLENLDSEQLALVLVAGLTPEELRLGHGVVFELLDRHDFVLDPLPNLVFARDSSFWIGTRVGVASLGPDRRREADLMGVVYRHHPRFARTRWLYQPDLETLYGGDVLLFGPGVVAVGVGQRTTPAGAERLARRLFGAGLAHTILAVPIGRRPGARLGDQVAADGAGHLDTVCTVIDHGALLMHPAAAYTLVAHTITPQPDGMRVSRPQPFLEAAAQAMGVDRVRVIDSGTEPGWGPTGRWDDGSNVLAIGRSAVVSHERNSDANARLEAAGVRVIRVPSSELGSIRGGPRCMACSISREPARGLQPQPEQGTRSVRPGLVAAPVAADPISVPGSRVPTYSDAIPAVGQASGAGMRRARGRLPQRGPADGQQPPRVLVAPPRPAGRAVRRPPDTDQQQAGRGHDQRDQGEPDQRPDDGRGHEYDEDHGQDQQHDAKHASTLRLVGGGLVAASGAGASMPARAAYERGAERAVTVSGEIGASRSRRDAHLAGPLAHPVVCGTWS